MIMDPLYWDAIVTPLFLLFSLGLVRLLYVMPAGLKKSQRGRRTAIACRTCVVLGSGGHTFEMLCLLDALPTLVYRPRSYVIADTDQLSEKKALSFEQREHSIRGKDFFIHRIPRAREVGQSYFTSIVSTFRSIVHSYDCLFNHGTLPELILCNGPGTCIPICLIAYIPRILGLKRIRIVYIESFARVTTLSLSGKILYYFADRFIVQWPNLLDRYPRAEYLGSHLV